MPEVIGGNVEVDQVTHRKEPITRCFDCRMGEAALDTHVELLYKAVVDILGCADQDIEDKFDQLKDDLKELDSLNKDLGTPMELGEPQEKADKIFHTHPGIQNQNSQ